MSKKLLTRWLTAVLWGGLMIVRPASAAAPSSEIEFNRDIRPILSDTCFPCHGPDEETREASLRLDVRELAVQAADSGAVPIVPGKPDESEFIRRIFSDIQDEQMPPAEAHKSLSIPHRELLYRWIAQGATYESHWAYATLHRSEPTQEHGTHSASTAIDGFIDAGLLKAGVEARPAADRITLIRRLAFDLTGLPPTVAEVDGFVNDTADDAYLQLVNRLLDSPRYGERMASYWLDLVRYADTVGYHGDQDVSQSPYRDYVIEAFNTNMPYDRFVLEQLAGDLLPSATTTQQIASGYNRLNQTTEEGGAQAKEYLAIYFADRVRNVSQVFLGATLGCAQCHDHKYDPYTARDFYSFGAFFADLEEVGKYNARSRPPNIVVPTAEQQLQLDDYDQRLFKLEARRQRVEKKLLAKQSQWEAELSGDIEQLVETEHVWVEDQQETGGTSSSGWKFVAADQGPVHSGSQARRQADKGLVQHYFTGAKPPVEVSANMRFSTWVYLDPKNPPRAIMLQINDGSWEHRAVWGNDDITYGRKVENWSGYQRMGELPAAGAWIRLEVDPAAIGLKPADKVNGMAFTQFGGLAYWDASGWLQPGLPADVHTALATGVDERTATQAQAIRTYYLSQAQPLVALQQTARQIQAERAALEAELLMTVVSRATEPRTIRILPRGNWMDDSGEIVEPAIPQFLGKLDTAGRRASRLDLARWLGAADNPLTARTMVNRLWMLMFGRGLSTSVDDLGGQGTFPTHPRLLDWLAVEFMESGWDFKHILRLIVTSQAYQRSSTPTTHLRTIDPYNNLLARQGRFRIEAEMVRDSVLATSGLLVEAIGGPSVKPYQPDDYYAQLNFPRRTYLADAGGNQYRRGVYTHWQRTFLHPMLKAFDAPSREECMASRARSSTPLQALTLLNDPSFVEAARVFATRIMREAGPTPEQRIIWAYRTAVSRAPEPAVAAELQSLYDQHLAYYRQHADQARELIATGQAPIAAAEDAAELAAWTSVARVLFNLHETIMRY